MSRSLISLLFAGLAGLTGLLAIVVWNQNYACAAECDILQREIERVRIENEGLELEALRHEGLPPEPTATDAAGPAPQRLRAARSRGSALARAGGT